MKALHLIVTLGIVSIHTLSFAGKNHEVDGLTGIQLPQQIDVENTNASNLKHPPTMINNFVQQELSVPDVLDRIEIGLENMKLQVNRSKKKSSTASVIEKMMRLIFGGVIVGTERVLYHAGVNNEVKTIVLAIECAGIQYAESVLKRNAHKQMSKYQELNKLYDLYREILPSLIVDELAKYGYTDRRSLGSAIRKVLSVTE